MSGPIPSPNNPVLRAINQRGAQVAGRRRRRRYKAAAYEIADVEAHFTNPQGGDADSAGFRQERRSLYPDPTNLPHSVDRLFRELAQHDRGQPSYELAADVQRPRADLRGRYRDSHNLALSLLDRGSGGVPAATRTRPATIAPGRVLSPGHASGTATDPRRELLAAFLRRSGRGNSFLFRSGLLDPTTSSPSLTGQVASSLPGAALTPRATDKNPRLSVPSPSGVNAAVRAARKRLGAFTEDTGSNRGRKLDKLEGKFGMVGQPWCGIFAGTVLRHAGVKGVGSWIASVASIEQRARAGQGPFEGFTSGRHARPGDLVIPVKGEHVAVVERVDRNGTIHVIGGNNSNGTVGRATYNADSVHGIARVRYQRRPRRRR